MLNLNSYRLLKTKKKKKKLAHVKYLNLGARKLLLSPRCNVSLLVNKKLLTLVQCWELLLTSAMFVNSGKIEIKTFMPHLFFKIALSTTCIFILKYLVCATSQLERCNGNIFYFTVTILKWLNLNYYCVSVKFGVISMADRTRYTMFSK